MKNKCYIVALDIGGTKIAGVLFDENYKKIREERVFFPKQNTKSTVSISRKMVLDLIANVIDSVKGDEKIIGIGVSIPDVISASGSIIGTSKITVLSNYNLSEYIEKKYKVPVKVANDADCFALAEARLGAGKEYRNVIGVIFGTGIGSGIVIDGKIYSGTTGSAGEFGFNIVNPNGPIARNGFRGSVESYAGGPNLLRNYIKLGGKTKDANPAIIFKSKEVAAKKAIDMQLKYLSIGLAGLMNILNPGIIVMGGGQSNLPVYRQLNSYTKKYTIDGLRPHVKIVKNKLGDSAGIYGAGILVFDKSMKEFV